MLIPFTTADHASPVGSIGSADDRQRPRHQDDGLTVAHLVVLGRVRRVAPPVWSIGRHCGFFAVWKLRASLTLLAPAQYGPKKCGTLEA